MARPIVSQYALLNIKYLHTPDYVLLNSARQEPVTRFLVLFGKTVLDGYTGSGRVCHVEMKISAPGVVNAEC